MGRSYLLASTVAVTSVIFILFSRSTNPGRSSGKGLESFDDLGRDLDHLGHTVEVLEARPGNHANHTLVGAGVAFGHQLTNAGNRDSATRLDEETFGREHPSGFDCLLIGDADRGTLRTP